MKFIDENFYKLIKLIAEHINYADLSERQKEHLARTALFEQAQERHEFVQLIDNIAWEIAEHICLVLFFQQYRTNKKENMNHWKSEIKAHCNKIIKKKIKCGDKVKVLNYAFFEYADFYSSEHIFNGLYDKFYDEGIDIYKEQYAVYDIIEQFQEILKTDLIPILANPKALVELREYIENL